MKTLAACLTCLTCSTPTTSLLAQGLIAWNNTASTLISLNGSAMPVPVRASEGTTYHFGLFIAPLGTPAPVGVNDPNWQFVVGYTMNSTAAAGAGRMQNPGTATVIGYEAGTSVNFIVRAWQSFSGGADWPAAKSGLQVVGQSALGTAILGGGPYPTPTAFGSSAGQISGFNFGCLECTPPWFVTNPSNAVVSVGSDVTLTAYALGFGPPNPNGPLFVEARYQWRKQGSPISGATNSGLALKSITLNDAGNYDVVATGTYGNTPSTPATVTVFIPAIAATLASPVYTANNQFQFTVTGSAGSNYVVQVATNLTAPTTWISVVTNASPFTFVDSNAQNFPQRFYRAPSR